MYPFAEMVPFGVCGRTGGRGNYNLECASFARLESPVSPDCTFIAKEMSRTDGAAQGLGGAVCGRAHPRLNPRAGSEMVPERNTISER